MANEDDLLLHHLADVHTVIGRLSRNSFVIRGWSVTLVTLVSAIVTTQTDRPRVLVLVALPPAVIFWVLDAYYLRQERLFRNLYSEVGGALSGRVRAPGAPSPVPVLFDMTVDRFARRVPSLAASLFIGHVVAIPAMLTAVVTAYVLFGSSGSGW